MVIAHDQISGPMLIHAFLDHLTCFSNENSITLSRMKLIHHIGGFAVSKGGDGVGHVCVWESERLVGGVDGHVL